MQFQIWPQDGRIENKTPQLKQEGKRSEDTKLSVLDVARLPGNHWSQEEVTLQCPGLFLYYLINVLLEVILFIYFFSTRSQTQGLEHSRKVFYH